MGPLEHSKKRLLKGSRSWALAYAVISIRHSKARSLGIALLLGIGMALPTAIFSWGSTTQYIMLQQLITEDPYQFSLKVSSHTIADVENLQQAASTTAGEPIIGKVDQYVSTAAIVNYLDDVSVHPWDVYEPNYPMPAMGVQDTRVIPVTKDKMARLAGAFNWEGNRSIRSGQVLIGAAFAQNIAEIYRVSLAPGDVIGFDIVEPHDWKGGMESSYLRSDCEIEDTGHLTIAGIFDPKSLTNALGDAFPAMMRQDPWTDPILGIHEAVFGLADSVFILEDDLNPQTVTDMGIYTIFNPVALAQVSIPTIMSEGLEKYEELIESAKSRILLHNPDVKMKVSMTLEENSEFLSSISKSQVFTLLATPIILMSMFLTIFSSRTSIQEKSREITILRSKGASYNQVLSAAVGEALLLSLFAFLIGLGLAYLFIPLMSAADSATLINSAVFFEYLNNLQWSIFSLIIGASLVMFLPGLYMIHVNASIGVFEIGQPLVRTKDDDVAEVSLRRFVFSFLILVLALINLPVTIPPYGTQASLTILSIAVLLFAISYVGSRMMQQIVAHAARGAEWLLGQKVLYVIKSLQKRHSKFIPLMVILTLTLTTTTMMVIENSSFESTLANEIAYAYGADIRIETPEPRDIPTFTDELERYAFVEQVSPVIEMLAHTASDYFNVEGINPDTLAEVCKFSPDSFVDTPAATMLLRLKRTYRGIIVSSHFRDLYNKSIGDRIPVYLHQGELELFEVFEIVGFVNSMPGLGNANADEGGYSTIASKLGNQVRPGGFALINQQFLRKHIGVYSAKYFFVKADVDTAIPDFCAALAKRYNVRVGTPYQQGLPEELEQVAMFVNGMRGFIYIGFVMCGVMAVSAIVLFFGSAVRERRPEYAILKAVGASQHQISSIVLGEFSGLIASIIILATVLGIIFGNVISSILFMISPFALILPEIITVELTVALGFSLLEWGLMLAACFYPARMASATEMVEELRNL